MLIHLSLKTKFVIVIFLLITLIFCYFYYQNLTLKLSCTKLKFHKVSKLVLAFYYPWYGSKYGPTHAWRHWRHWYLNTTNSKIIKWYNPNVFINHRRDIGAAHYPLLGPYDCLNETIIKIHFKWAEEAGIDAFVCSWWGISSFEDKVFRKMLEIAEREHFKIKLTIYYESVGLTRNRSSKDVANDIIYIIRNYAKYSSFLKYKGKPVIFVYAVEVQPKMFWSDVINYLKKANISVLLIADTMNEFYADIFSGIHIYNPLDKLLIDPTGSLLNFTYKWMKEIAERHHLIFVATVTPGYNDTKVRWPGKVLDRESGRIYNITWRVAIANRPDWIIITTWNEWHEGTEIEPSLEYNYKYLNLTAYWVKRFKKT